MGDDENVVNQAVGEAVRRSIRDAGSSVRVASERAGLNYRSVRRYLAGERDMPVPALLALVRASNADLAQLTARLLQETSPNPTDHSPHLLGAADPDDSDGEDAVQVHVHARLRQLGVTRLAARSVAPISPDELDAVANVVEQIVREVREDRSGTSVGGRG